ncbi:hypothetical protein [Streptomyces sp. MspMP-M5]|uniref:hypothetical protein n=1 Tax=unclassified Streptomyces TaxID=2593676 RepID=UPI0003613DEC|nr:hypothetical protein [Streptomyces sp. MspMP-M5]MYT33253.1 hypothetical protein [Streptomyces sp. SID8354]
MSYPNPNPYGPPPGQQPGYGYPQQPMQPQPPQQQPMAPYGPYPGGPMPAAQMPYPTVMPGGVKAARALLFVLAGLNLIGLVLAVMGLGDVTKASHKAASSPYEDMSMFSVGKGVLIAVIAIIVIFTVAAITLAAQFANGGKGVRVATIVSCVIGIVMSLGTFPFGLVHTVLGILVLVFVSKDDGNAWFSRPRY